MRIENYTAQELFDQLNEVDEAVAGEAKAALKQSIADVESVIKGLING